MNPVALLVGQFVVVTVGVIAAWIVATRRLPAPWSAIGWGALTFPLSQVARYIVLIPVTLGLGAVLGATSPVMTTVGIVLAVLTSGIFEEGARWIVMRYWAKGVRTWPTGVAFGLGHGGIEALLLIGMNAINGVVLFSRRRWPAVPWRNRPRINSPRSTHRSQPSRASPSVSPGWGCGNAPSRSASTSCAH